MPSSFSMCSPSQAKDIKTELKSFFFFCQIPVFLLQNPLLKFPFTDHPHSCWDPLGLTQGLHEMLSAANSWQQSPRLSPGFSKHQLHRHHSTPLLGTSIPCLGYQPSTSSRPALPMNNPPTPKKPRVSSLMKDAGSAQ